MHRNNVNWELPMALIALVLILCLSLANNFVFAPLFQSIVQTLTPATAAPTATLPLETPNPAVTPRPLSLASPPMAVSELPMAR